MAATLGRMLSRMVTGTAWRPWRRSVLVLRLEGTGALVARVGPDEADRLCQRLHARLADALTERERLLGVEGNEVALALTGESEGEVLARAAHLRRGCEAPVQGAGGKLSLRVTAVLAQPRGRMQPGDAALTAAATAHLRALPASRLGTLWTIERAAGPWQGAPDATAGAPAGAAPPASPGRVILPGGPAGEALPAGAASLLSQALREGGVEPWFLPIYACATGMPLGFELRPRWRHPRLGLSGTTAFRGALSAEERRALTQLLLARAADALRGLGAAGFKTACLSVPVSRGDLAEANFAELLLWEADRADIAPTRLELSFAEDALPPAAASAAAAGAIAANLRRLRAAGVGLTLSAFGSGALAPEDVRGFGVGGVTLDRGLVRGLGASEAQPILVSLLALAARERLTVTADGVASTESLALLARLGCHRARGPGLGRTVPLADCAAQMARPIPLWDGLPPLFRTRR